MYYLNSPQEFISSVFALTVKDGDTCSDISELRNRYIDFAVSLGGEAVHPSNISDSYCYKEDRILSLISKYKDYSQLTDIETDTSETSHRSRVNAMKAVNEGRKHLKKSDNELGSLLDFAIHTMFYHRSKESGGGSVSSAPGVIWCSPRLNWTKEDMAEFLVHELAHNMIFIDERRYQHYIDFDEIAKPDNYAKSAILMKPRPLDKVFHSLIVSNEVLSYRMKHGEPVNPNVHPGTQKMYDAALETTDTIRELLKRKTLVTPRFLELMDKVETSLEAIKNANNLKAAA